VLKVFTLGTNFYRGLFMGKCFYIFIFLCGVQLHASDTFVISKDLGKPPLAKPKERIALQMKQYRKSFEKQSLEQYSEFLNGLLKKIEQKATTENTESLFKELTMYYDTVKTELEAVGQALAFEMQQNVNVDSKELEYTQDAQNILDKARSTLTSKDYKKRVKELIKLTGDALLNDNVPYDEVCRLQVAFNVFNDAYKSLK
jgi:hypothetical protein